MEQNGDVMGVMNMEAAEDAPSWIRVRVLRSRAPSCKIFTLPTQASRVCWHHRAVGRHLVYIQRQVYSVSSGTVSKGTTVYIKYIANVYFYLYF